MRNQNLARFVCALLCAVSLLTVQTFARAGVIGAEQFLNASERQATLDDIDAVLARNDVRAQLERYGVDPAEARERAAALSDQELMALADNLESLPAGGSVLGTIGVVFIVLLILELVGVINIFNRI